MPAPWTLGGRCQVSPENRWWTGQALLQRTDSYICWAAERRPRMALLHMSSLEMGTALQRSLYVTAKVSAESRSPLTLREGKSPVVGPTKATHTWGPQADGPCRAWSPEGRRLGRGSTPRRAGRTCSHSDQAPWRGHCQ